MKKKINLKAKLMKNLPFTLAIFILSLFNVCVAITGSYLAAKVYVVLFDRQSSNLRFMAVWIVNFLVLVVSDIRDKMKGGIKI